MSLPPPNLQGNDEGSCVVCQRETDTAMAFVGDAEWLTAGLQVLGIPDDEASIMVLEFKEKAADPGMVASGEYTMRIRLCAECVSKASATLPAPSIPSQGGGVPSFEQRPHRRVSRPRGRAG